MIATELPGIQGPWRREVAPGRRLAVMPIQLTKGDDMDLASVITKGTMVASIRMITEPEKFPGCRKLLQEDQVESIVLALRKSLSATLISFLGTECRAAVEIGLSEEALREMLNVYCNHTAMIGLQELETFLRGDIDAS